SLSAAVVVARRSSAGSSPSRKARKGQVLRSSLRYWLMTSSIAVPHLCRRPQPSPHPDVHVNSRSEEELAVAVAAAEERLQGGLLAAVGEDQVVGRQALDLMQPAGPAQIAQVPGERPAAGGVGGQRDVLRIGRPRRRLAHEGEE